MDTFVWNDRYLTGESLVDNEHRELVRIINQVGALEAGDASDTVATQSILEQLVQYTVDHFAHEEGLMIGAGCDPRHVALHQKIHREFAAQVTVIRQVSAGAEDAQYLLRYLSNWLAYHILDTDQAMTRQVHHIRGGMPPAQAYALEQSNQSDPATPRLLEALSSLYRVIASRNQALVDLNLTLEQRVDERTEALQAANAELIREDAELKAALETVKQTQLRLFESERARSLETQRNMEQFLAQIVDGDPVPTLVIDAQHKVTHWNKACELICGVPAEAMIGTDRHWSAFYATERPLMADLVINADMDAIQTLYRGKFRRSPVIPGAFEAENFFPQFGEHGRWLFFTAAPLRNPSGQIVGAIETLQDITERKQAEEALRQHQANLEQLVAERTQQLSATKDQLVQSEKLASIGQLAAGVAHEINNPIGFVHSNIGTLEAYMGSLFAMLDAYEAAESSFTDPALLAQMKGMRQKVDLAFLKEDVPLLMKESKDGISRVKRIVQDLKDFSRVDSTQEWQWADLHQGIDSTANIVANEIRYKADLIKDYGDLPEVECLPSQLNQVFMNLLVNAAHAIGETRGQITIRTGVSGDTVWLEFADTGSGIPEPIRQKVFDPFFTTKPVGKGTGLGLSLSYGIVQKHHGHIEVQSEVGKGSTFRITLPIKHVD